MSIMKIMISFVFLYLIVFSFAHGEDHWKEYVQKRLIRAAGKDFSFWQNFFWTRSTTRRTFATTKSTKGPTTTAKTNGPTPPTITDKVTPISTGKPSSSFTTFQNEALAQTNIRRAAHCAPNIILNATLNDIAQAYANTLARLDTLKHSGDSRFGENLYYTGSSQPIDVNTINGKSFIKDSSFNINSLNRYNSN